MQYESVLIVLRVNANVDQETSHQKGLNMGPSRFHTTANNSQGDLRLPRFHKNLGSRSHDGRIQACLCTFFYNQSILYAIHNIVLFSKCRGDLFPVMACRKPPKMNTAAKNIIPTSAFQLLQTKLRFAMAASPSTNHTYSKTSCSTSSGRLLMCKLLPIVR